MLKQVFWDLALQHTNTSSVVQLWHEIESRYTAPDRHYHNLSHLDHMLSEVSSVRSEIDDWDTVLFAMFYHDIIYNPLALDNEEKSAELAVIRLRELSFPEEGIHKCSKIILATKGHNWTEDSDTRYFTDADLSILGKDWNCYIDYCKKIREEYLIFPDSVYRTGRQTVLNHFLEMQRIFKTEHFFNHYEKFARQNIKKEMDILNDNEFILP